MFTSSSIVFNALVTAVSGLGNGLVNGLSFFWNLLGA